MQKMVRKYFDPIGASYVGLVLMAYGAGWIRGYVSGSGLPQVELAQQTAANGPYLPFFAVLAGWVIIGAGLLTWYQTREKRPTA